MAGTVREYYTWMPTVKIGTSPVNLARVEIWNLDGTKHSGVGLVTGSDGTLLTGIQELTQAVHSITLTDTVATTNYTPHKIRTLFYGNSDLDSPNGVYGCRVDEFSKDVARQASVNTIFLDLDPLLSLSRSTVAGWTGISYSSDTLTLTLARSVTDIYMIHAEANYDDPKYTPKEFMEALDSNNFIHYYNLVINGVVLTGQGKTITFDGTKKLTFQAAASLSGSLTIIGDVVWGTTTSISSLSVQSGALDFTAAGTYTLTDCNIAEVTNSSGGAVTINAVNTTITLNTGPNITINNAVGVNVTVLDDSTGLALQYARVRLNKVSDKSLIMSEETDVNGLASTTFNYLSDTPIEGWVRQWDLVGEDYTPKNVSGTIVSSGFSLTVRLAPI
jgi:hypothetical protein